jgi:alanine racemase
MTFALHVDAVPFRAHLAAVRDRIQQLGGQLTPVIKGNGYGFGRQILAQESELLGLSRIAVGTVWELEQALAQFNGQVQVLEPFNASDHRAMSQWKQIAAHHAHRIIATISSDDLVSAHSAGIQNVMLDALTSLNRFGLATHEVIHLMRSIPEAMTIHGLALHLPIADSSLTQTAVLEVNASETNHSATGRQLEVHSWLLTYRELAEEHALPLHVSLSHIDHDELTELVGQHPEFSFELRLGTSLWLGAPDSLQVSGVVLAIHEVARNQRIGYRQIQSERNQRLAVISGGTAHGVALAAPSARVSLRAKTIALVEGLSEARGKVRSPFSTAGKNLIFAEPPHMHVSLLWCGDSALQVGDQVTCNVRNTTAQFDVVTGLN